MPDSNSALIEFHPRLTTWLSLSAAAGVFLFLLLHWLGIVHYSHTHLLLKGTIILVFLLTAWGTHAIPRHATRLFLASLAWTTAAIGLIVIFDPQEHMALIFMGFAIFGGFLLGGSPAGIALFFMALLTLSLLYLRHPDQFDNGFYVYLSLFFTLCAMLSAALSLHLKHLFRKTHQFEKNLVSIAHHDELTGLLNLRGFLRKGQVSFEYHRRTHQPMALALIDLDYFKQLNDSLGHGAGNTGLKHVADTMRSVFPDNTLLGRFGGDEMIALLPLSDERQTRDTLQRLLTKLNNPPPSLKDTSFTLSLSIGVAMLNPRQDRTLDDLLQRADKALYHAKALGRSCACLSGEHQPFATLPKTFTT